MNKNFFTQSVYYSALNAAISVLLRYMLKRRNQDYAILNLRFLFYQSLVTVNLILIPIKIDKIFNTNNLIYCI